jgi:uncharacterized protein YqhQ
MYNTDSGHEVEWKESRQVGQFNYGGQAVIEGVMMRGTRCMAVAVRHPNGEIVIHSEPLTAGIYTSSWGRLPFIRGLAMLWDALVLGVRTLMFSANIALAEEEDVSFSGPVAWGTLAISLVFGIGFFFVTPLLVVRLLDWLIHSSLLGNVVEGLVRLALFLGYIVLIARLPDIQRVFAYHGAEHKTINAYEAGADLTVEQVRQFSTLHPRCGTGFLLVVMVLSIFVFSLIGKPPLWLGILSRVALIPVIAGLSYEFIRFSAARYQCNRLLTWLISPSLALQTLTTREPDDSMLEVAITALTRVLVGEGITVKEASQGETALEPAMA